MSEYTFNRLTKERLKDVCKIFIASTRKGFSPEKLFNKYETGFTGKQFIAYIAYDSENNPAAFYGIIPCFAKYNNQKILIAQAVDGITHPNHQRKGLFLQLISRVTELAKKEGVNFIYGIPNEKSFPAFRDKVKWTVNNNMIIYKFPVVTLPISSIFRYGKISKSLYQAYTKMILCFLTKSSELFENPGVNDQTFGINRDNDFLEYKNRQFSKHIFLLSQKKVWLSIDGAMKVGDIETTDPTTLKKIIKKLKLLSFFLGVRKVVFQFSPESKHVPIFSTIRKPEVGLPIIYLNISNKYDPAKFVISLADFDTY
jgi:hypothetical protein